MGPGLKPVGSVHDRSAPKAEPPTSQSGLKSGPGAHAARHAHAGTAQVHIGIGIPRSTACAVPSPQHRTGTAAHCSPGHTGREAQRPRGLARPRRDLHALQSQRFKVRSAGRPSPAWPRRYSSPRRREPLARPPQRVNGRAPPPSEALCVSARPAGPARDVPARPAAPLRQRPSPMLISLAARLGGRPAAGSPLRPLPGPLPPGSPCCQESPAPLAARCPPPHSSSTPCARRPLGCQECPGPVGKAVS